MARGATIEVEIADAVLPLPAARRIAVFLAQQVSGRIELDVTNGQITGMRVTEALRLDKRKT